MDCSLFKKCFFLFLFLIPFSFFRFLSAMEQPVVQPPAVEQQPAVVRPVQQPSEVQQQPAPVQQRAEVQQPAEARHHSRNLIIFSGVDSLESDVDAIDKELLQALSANVFPIIVRKCVIKNIVRNLNLIVADSPIPQLNRLQALVTNWHIFNTNRDDYCILVPSPENEAEATVIEHARRLGFLVYEQLYDGKLTSFITQKDLTFDLSCKAKDVAAVFMDPSEDYQWNIYLVGHGSKSHIVGFTINEFRDFLYFLNSRRINALVYKSCFGAGKHLIEPYIAENNEQKPLRLNFAMACQSARFSLSVADEYFDFHQLFRELDNRATYQSWDQCFQAAFRENEHNRGCEYGKFLIEGPDYSNFPWIRNPGEENFHLLPLPLYNAQPYTSADNQQQERPVILTLQTHTLLVQTPCVNRPISSDSVPAVISVSNGDNPSHYLASMTVPMMSLEKIALQSFRYPYKYEEAPSTFLIEECRCQRESNLHRYINVRIQNRPIGFWYKFINFMKYGKNASCPKLSKEITAECEDGKIIQATINQKVSHTFNWRAIFSISAKALINLLAGIICHRTALSAASLTQWPRILNGCACLNYGVMVSLPIIAWIASRHIISHGQLSWPTTCSWKTLSAVEAQNYRNELQRQRQELFDLAASQQASVH